MASGWASLCHRQTRAPQAVARYRVRRSLHQRRQHGKFARRQLNRLAVGVTDAGCLIDRQRAKIKPRRAAGLHTTATAPQQGEQTRLQFVEIKGLGQ